MGAAREHGIIDAVNNAGIQVLADSAYQGGGPAVRLPFRRRRLNRDTGRYRPLSANQKAVNTAHARRRGPGERANAELNTAFDRHSDEYPWVGNKPLHAIDPVGEVVAVQSRWFAEIATDYVQEHRDRARTELAYFRDLPTDEAAVSSAALSELPSGKRHPHQHRIERVALDEGRRRLLGNLQVL